MPATYALQAVVDNVPSVNHIPQDIGCTGGRGADWQIDVSRAKRPVEGYTIAHGFADVPCWRSIGRNPPLNDCPLLSPVLYNHRLNLLTYIWRCHVPVLSALAGIVLLAFGLSDSCTGFVHNLAHRCTADHIRPLIRFIYQCYKALAGRQ